VAGSRLINGEGFWQVGQVTAKGGVFHGGGEGEREGEARGWGQGG